MPTSGSKPVVVRLPDGTHWVIAGGQRHQITGTRQLLWAQVMYGTATQATHSQVSQVPIGQGFLELMGGPNGVEQVAMGLARDPLGWWEPGTTDPTNPFPDAQYVLAGTDEFLVMPDGRAYRVTGPGQQASLRALFGDPQPVGAVPTNVVGSVTGSGPSDLFRPNEIEVVAGLTPVAGGTGEGAPEVGQEAPSGLPEQPSPVQVPELIVPPPPNPDPAQGTTPTPQPVASQPAQGQPTQAQQTGGAAPGGGPVVIDPRSVQQDLSSAPASAVPIAPLVDESAGFGFGPPAADYVARSQIRYDPQTDRLYGVPTGWTVVVDPVSGSAALWRPGQMMMLGMVGDRFEQGLQVWGGSVSGGRREGPATIPLSALQAAGAVALQPGRSIAEQVMGANQGPFGPPDATGQPATGGGQQAPPRPAPEFTGPPPTLAEQIQGVAGDRTPGFAVPNPHAAVQPFPSGGGFPPALPVTGGGAGGGLLAPQPAPRVDTPNPSIPAPNPQPRQTAPQPHPLPRPLPWAGAAGPGPPPRFPVLRNWLATSGSREGLTWLDRLERR